VRIRSYVVLEHAQVAPEVLASVHHTAAALADAPQAGQRNAVSQLAGDTVQQLVWCTLPK
jgi:hypothetical protein